MRDHVTNLRYEVYNRKAQNFAYSFNYLSDVQLFISEVIIPAKVKFSVSVKRYQDI